MVAWQLVYTLPLLIGLSTLLPIFAWISILNKNYGTDTQTVTAIVATCINFITFFVSPLGGKLSDKIGRNIPLAITTAMMPAPLISLSFHNELSIMSLLIAMVICSGIGQAVVCILQSYIIDNSLPDEKTKNLGIMYATIAFGFLLGGGLGAVIEGKYPLRGMTFEKWAIEEEVADFQPVLDAHTLLLRYVGICLIGFGVLVSVFLPKGTVNRTEIEKMKDENDRSINLFDSITYIMNAKPNIKHMAMLNILRVAAFQPVTTGFGPYMQLRFKDKSPNYVTFVMVSGIMGIIANLNIKFIAKKFGRKQVIVIGFLFYAFKDIGYGIIQESFYIAFFVPASFAFLCFTANTMLDSVTSSFVSSEEQGTVMGVMSQCRAIASFVLTIPCGLLFSYSDKLSKEYREKENVNDVYFQGFPFIVFSIFGFIGAIYVATSINSVDINNTTLSHKQNEAGYYTKLNDENDMEIDEADDDDLSMARLVGSRSPSFVEMT